MTASIPAAQTAIDGWTVGNGCDVPEAQFNALNTLATDPAVGFRADSTRIIVWFGDASGHDPSGGHTLTDAIDALVAADIKVIAVPVVSGSGTGSMRPGRRRRSRPQRAVSSSRARLRATSPTRSSRG